MSEPIVISGMGVVSPIGVGTEAFWDGLYSGRSGAVSMPAFESAELPRRVACPVRDALAGDAPAGARAAQLAINAARQAVDAAGLDLAALDAERVAVAIGTTMGETEAIESRLDSESGAWLSAEHMQQVMRVRPGSIAANVQQALGVSAAALDLYGACAAGNMAIGWAVNELRGGRCDVVIAGGADGFSQLAFLGFMRLRIMSEGVCRPFDTQRDGLLVGEGAGVLVLERESHARARGATIHARVLGCANACESHHPTRPDPNGDGLRRAVVAALDDAGLSPSDIEYVCAHGTGTEQNDQIEVKVMRQVFERGTPFSSYKALTGHTMGAAAAIEAVGCVLSLQHQTMIPTWHLGEPIETDLVEALHGGPRPAKLRCVQNNSAGFGGYNSSVILGAA